MRHSKSGRTTEDVVAITAANQAYASAWLSDNPEAVMSVLTDDAVPIPHHGDEPAIGAEAIREFWFPADSPPVKVTHMVKSVTDVQGSGDIAFAWGRSELEFVFAETTYRNGGDSLSVLRKGGEGRWRIARRIWNDPIADQD